MKLWVDDLRPPPDDTWRWVTDPFHTIGIILAHYITHQEVLEALSLDHDLGGELTTRDIVLFLCEQEIYWPKEVYVHSQNPVGKTWLESMIERYKK